MDAPPVDERIVGPRPREERGMMGATNRVHRTPVVLMLFVALPILEFGPAAELLLLLLLFVVLFVLF